MQFILEWFGLENDLIIGDEMVNLTVEQVQAMFHEFEDDLSGLLPLTASHRKKIQPFVQHQIDLNQFDYFISLVQN